MPTQRKRIGYLPRSEVKNLIDKICNHNKLSQSKVTGILVEEALFSRGVLKSTKEKLSFDFVNKKSQSISGAHDAYKSEMNNKEENFNLEQGYLKDEVQMINDFIEFKFFKNIMNKNKRKN